MEPTAIPTHDKPLGGGNEIWVERIEPMPDAVINSVHRHTYHEMFIFSTGTGTHMIDLEQVPFVAPCIHFVAPGQVHKLDRSADTTGFVVMFSKDLRQGVFLDPRVRAILRAGSDTRSVTLDQDCLNEAIHVIAIIEQEQHCRALACASVLENLLAVLLLKCMRWSGFGDDGDRSDRPGDPVTRFLEKVDQEFRSKKQVSAYARDLSVSPGHLTELVKKKLGRSASDILHERLLLEAKRLLLHADISVKEVSFELQMDDPAYFARMFKKATGMTPVDYRQHIREKYQQ